jgi:hypothetical protein
VTVSSTWSSHRLCPDEERAISSQAVGNTQPIRPLVSRPTADPCHADSILKQEQFLVPRICGISDRGSSKTRIVTKTLTALALSIPSQGRPASPHNPANAAIRLCFFTPSPSQLSPRSNGEIQTSLADAASRFVPRWRSAAAIQRLPSCSLNCGE